MVKKADSGLFYEVVDKRGMRGQKNDTLLSKLCELSCPSHKGAMLSLQVLVARGWHPGHSNVVPSGLKCEDVASRRTPRLLPWACECRPDGDWTAALKVIDDPHRLGRKKTINLGLNVKTFEAKRQVLQSKTS